MSFGSSYPSSSSSFGMPSQSQYGQQPPSQYGQPQGMPLTGQQFGQQQGMPPPGYMLSGEQGIFNGAPVPLFKKNGFFGADYAAVIPVAQKVNYKNGVITAKLGGGKKAAKSQKMGGGKHKRRRGTRKYKRRH